MCLVHSLQVASRALCTLRLICSLYLLVVGSMLVDNIHMSQAFGRDINFGGGIIILCSILGFVSTTLNLRGSSRHNKFILLVYTALDASLFLLQVSIGVRFLNLSAPDYSAAFQRDCLLSEPLHNTLEECQSYTDSDRFGHMLLVWSSYSYLALANAAYFQKVAGIQTDGLCCGFGPPLRCVADDRSLPPSPTRSTVTWSDDTRYVCGDEPGWYGADYFCEQLVDEAAIFPEVGGCRYDRPVGDCMDIIPGAETRGCAAEIDSLLSGYLAREGAGILIVSMLIPLMMMTACCLIGKRSDIDVLPDHIAAEEAEKEKYAAIKVTAAPASDILDRIFGAPSGYRKKSQDHYDDFEG